jgi:membrane protein
LSYYTVFSLPALLVIVVSLAGLWWENVAVQARVETEIASLAGPRAAEQVGAILQSVEASRNVNCVETATPSAVVG